MGCFSLNPTDTAARKRGGARRLNTGSAEPGLLTMVIGGDQDTEKLLGARSGFRTTRCGHGDSARPFLLWTGNRTGRCGRRSETARGVTRSTGTEDSSSFDASQPSGNGRPPLYRASNLCAYASPALRCANRSGGKQGTSATARVLRALRLGKQRQKLRPWEQQTTADAGTVGCLQAMRPFCCCVSRNASHRCETGDENTEASSRGTRPGVHSLTSSSSLAEGRQRAPLPLPRLLPIEREGQGGGPRPEGGMATEPRTILVALSEILAALGVLFFILLLVALLIVLPFS